MNSMTRSEINKNTWKKRLLNHKYAVELDIFKNPSSPEVAYILGILWADGNVYIKGNHYTIAIECVEEDINYFEPIFKLTGNWKRYNRHRKNRKPQSTLKINHKPLALYLRSLGYKSKHDSHNKILQTIPNHLIKYWILGFLDGDGCVYIPKNDKSGICISFAGPYGQDWKFFQDLLKSFEIDSKLSLRLFKNGNKGSEIRIRSKNGIRNFISLVYNTNFKSLPRKRKKALSILEKKSFVLVN